MEANAPTTGADSRQGPDGPDVAVLPPPRCANCDAPVTQRFCGECGQRVANLQLSVGRLFVDVFKDYFHLDSKLLRTLRTLVLKPGALTADYLAGRRERYIRPLKVYLAASVTFFSLLAISPPGGMVRVQAGDGKGPVFVGWRSDGSEASGADGTPLEDAAKAPLQATSPGVSAPAVTAQATAAAPSAKVPAPITAAATGEVPTSAASSSSEVPSSASDWKERLRHRMEKEPELVRERVPEAMTRYVPRLMFFLVPFFALLLKALYWRRLYVEHFIFALHGHAIVYLALLVGKLLPLPAVILILPAFAWLFLAMRKVYGQGRFWSGLKLTLLSFTYMIVIATGVGLVIVGSLVVD